MWIKCNTSKRGDYLQTNSTPITNCRLSQATGIFCRKLGRVPKCGKSPSPFYSSPKEGLPYLAVIIAPNGSVAAAAAYKTVAEAETYSLKIAMETAKALFKN
jgi:hypothetical protein